MTGADVGPREAFAERFALLYAEAGDPTLKRVVQQVARIGRLDERGRPIRLSTQRISDWRRGHNVPARFAPLAAVLEVLVVLARRARPCPLVEELYELDSWRAWWEAALASPADAATASADQPSPVIRSDPSVCPYRGLAVFRPEDAEWFFGRDRGTAELVERLVDVSRTGGIVTLVGASGAGKSSLLRAGLVPALNKEGLPGGTRTNWPVVIMTPGDDPMGSLGRAVPELAESLDEYEAQPHDLRSMPDVRDMLRAHAERRGGVGARLVLVVDQFEELFTLCGDEDRRGAFVRLLHEVCMPTTDDSPITALVVLGLRADFYGRCLDYPELAQALQDRQMVLGPMTIAEVREAVVGPAKAVGLQVQSGLMELMLRDIGFVNGHGKTADRHGAHDVGALPLLSHALLATWQRRQGGRLTIAGYRAAHEIRGAIAATAERAWGNLDTAGQAAARLLLLRLVRVGEDTRDTRRHSTKQEVVERAQDPAAAADALEVLTKARLLTQDDGSVEITHEALLQAWPRLRNWIDEDRAGNLLWQRLEEDAKAWVTARRDSSLLYRGARLEAAVNWAATPGPVSLTSVAREFLAISTRHVRRATRARRAAVAAVVVFALLAATAAAVAVRQRSTANQQRDDAVFNQVVAEADRLADSDPSLSAQLDLVAHQMRPADQDVYTRLIATENAPLATPLTGHTGAVFQTSFSPNGNTLATASYDNTVRLWDVHDPTHPVLLGGPLTGHTSWVSSAVFSPDSRTLATASNDGTLQLWNVTDPGHPARIGLPLTGHDGSIYLVAFSPNGRTLATANEDDTVRLWDVTDPAHATELGSPLTGHTAPVRSVVFSPDGDIVAAGSDDDTTLLWDVADPAHPVQLGQPLVGHTATVHSVAFSPDGRTLATGSDDKTIRLWNITDPARPALVGLPLTAPTGPVWSVAFSPDGHILAAGSMDGTARLWNLSDPANPSQLGQPLTGSAGALYAVGFSPDGHILATGGEDGRARLWSLPTALLIGHRASVNSTAFSPDGRLIATGANDGTIGIWDTTSPLHPAPLSFLAAPSDYVPSCSTCAGDVRFGPTGHLLATSSYDKIVQLWNIASPTRPTLLAPTLALHTRYSAPLALSPDGRTLVTGADDQTAQLWNITDPTHPEPEATLTGHTGYVNFAAFSPDGRTLATASADRTIRLWNVTDPTRPRALAQLTGHTDAVNAIAFSPDGRTVTSASDDQTIRLWDITDRAHPVPIGNPLTGHTGSVTSVAFSPNGHILASAGTDQTVRLWDVENRTEVLPLGQPISTLSGTGYALTFSPNGQFVAFADGANTVRLLDLNADYTIQRICATTHGVLTPEKWSQDLPPLLPYAPPCG